MLKTNTKKVIVVYRGEKVWNFYREGLKLFKLTPKEAKLHIENIKLKGWTVVYGDDPENAQSIA